MPGLRLCSIIFASALYCAQSLEAMNVQFGAGPRDQTDPARTPQSREMPAPDQQTSPPTQVRESPKGPKGEAWQTLEAGCAGNKVTERASATLVLGLLRNDPRARKLAEKALSDPRPEVRSAGAAALGKMGSRRSIPKLKKSSQRRGSFSRARCRECPPSNARSVVLRSFL